MSERRLAVSVDVDGIGLYYQIHGLDGAPAADPAWTVAVPRFMELFEAYGLRGTFFAVGKDLEQPDNRAVAERLVARGHELASHSYGHAYDLSRMGREAIDADLAACEHVLQPIRGTRPAGFRAPGYNLSPELEAVVAARGYAYDSSIFPCPPYFAARAAIIGAMGLIGRRSQSIVGRPADSLAPHAPYRLDTGTLELPIGVIPGLQFPLIGTSMSLVGAAGVLALVPLMRRMPFANFEFHAIDLLDGADVVDPALKRVQPDLRVPVAKKRAAFAAALNALVAGATARTLEEHAAELVSPSGTSLG